MTDPSTVARRAAERLAGSLDPKLPALTERVLAAGGESVETRSFDLGISLAIASLVVSAAQLAWQVLHDLQKDREARAKEQASAGATGAAGAAGTVRGLLVRRIEARLEERAEVAPAVRQRLIEVVVEETMAASSQAD